MPEQQARLLADRYELITPLGRGTMGTVWRARDRALGREVAIKEIRQDPGLTEEQRAELRERMVREGRTAARVSHPSVAAIHDVIVQDNSPWIIMELIEAVEVAVESIVPRVKLTAGTKRNQIGQAVLRKAVEHFGRSGGTTLRGLVGLLGDLPDGVSQVASASRIAGELADSLTAAMDNDPLFGGGAEPVDPGVLLTPSPGKKARVSVISLIGLPGEEQRQSFVNQLQMALFAWIKKHPAGDRPLGGLFVMDEAQTFAPATGMTACTRSTLALAAQARKYGLGLIFATQAPKGLHNQISGNAATQFFGLLNAPIQISAAKEMAQAKGGSVPDISRLTVGQFYLALEGETFVKTRIPMCLSHHPKAPLTTEEVIARAARQSPVSQPAT